MTRIEWTEATWNPIVGCSVVSPGCTNCYAMKAAWRMGSNPGTPQYHGLTRWTKGGSVWTGKVHLHEPALMAPLKRRTPTMYFVNSMGDLFHEDVPDDWIDRVFAVMAMCPQHTFQVLTKRADRMREYMRCRPTGRLGHSAFNLAFQSEIEKPGSSCPVVFDKPNIHAREWPLPNVWLGVSAEDQTRADERIPDLLATPAAVRFVSAEPLLGPVDMVPWLREIYWAADFSAEAGGGSSHGVRPRVNWIITGGESGPNARPMHPDWARSIRDQCVAAGVPFFFKQWGEWALARPKPSGRPGKYAIADAGGKYVTRTHHYPRMIDLFGGSAALECVGKKVAGRLLDGRTWDQMPGGVL
ncbi:phage Gp37/Gp68 family protein [Oceaniglobus trochenteri]|uniref:phage Gp37/Gp68 family protein n=1 Tax=Oceaniglobus trochenteri TaxID=2763260 RepID=UPI001CFFEC5B|nr:phage Gp37/Gp68 family protein [Oceaniglobus trochenteri]